MDKPTSLEVFKGGKKEPCLYCGKDPHPAQLACPRIQAIYISPEGYVEGIEFRDEPELPMAG